MTNEEAIKIINQNLSVAIHDADGINPEYEKQQVDSLRKALEALEKQIPKKPIQKNVGYFKELTKNICPMCKNEIDNVYYDYAYCPDCGQAILWGINK